MFTTHWCILYIFSCVMRNYCEGVFVFPFFPPKVWWVFLYTKLCSFLPMDPVHPVVSLGRWRSLIEKFQDCQLISSKKIVGRLGCWPPSVDSRPSGNRPVMDMKNLVPTCFFQWKFHPCEVEAFFEALSDQFSKKTGMMSSWGLLRCFFEMLIATSTGAVLPFLYILFWWGIEWSILYI